MWGDPGAARSEGKHTESTPKLSRQEYMLFGFARQQLVYTSLGIPDLIGLEIVNARQYLPPK